MKALNKKNITENFITIMTTISEDKSEKYIKRKKYYPSKNLIFNELGGILPSTKHLEAFIRKLINKLSMESSHIALSFLYIDLISQKVHICLQNIMNLIFIASLLSVKLLDDEIFHYAYYSNMVGMTQIQLAELECYFLELLDYELLVSVDDLTSCLNFLNL